MSSAPHKAFDNPTRQYTYDQLMDMVGQGGIHRSAQPQSETVMTQSVDEHLLPPMHDEFDEFEGYDAYEELDEPTNPPTTNVQALVNNPPGDGRRASTTAASQGRSLAAMARDIRAVAKQEPAPAARPVDPREEAKANAALSILNGAGLGRNSNGATMDITGGHKPSPAKARPSLPGMPGPRSLTPRKLAPIPTPEPQNPRHNAKALMALPPPEIKTPEPAARPRSNRLETLESAKGPGKAKGRGKKARSAQAPPRRTQLARSIIWLAVLAPACFLMHLFLPKAWWAAAVGIALMPVLALSVTTFGTRLFAWIRMPRPLVIVFAAITAAISLLCAAFVGSWAVNLADAPWPHLQQVTELSSKLNAQLSSLTQLSGLPLMMWWAALLLAVTMSASLLASRATR